MAFLCSALLNKLNYSKCSYVFQHLSQIATLLIKGVNKKNANIDTCWWFWNTIGEETELRPKPMVEIGGKPILWHIMKIYSQYGYNDFVVLLGYKGYLIKEYFAITSIRVMSGSTFKIIQWNLEC